MLPPVFVDLVAGAWHDDWLSRAMNAAVVAAVLALSLVVTPGAVALPGDPGFVASSPADGAALPIDPGGIGVAYTCPSIGPMTPAAASWSTAGRRTTA